MRKLTLDYIQKNNMNWLDVVRHYFPNVKRNEYEAVLWEHTSYPVSPKLILKQLYEYYLTTIKK